MKSKFLEAKMFDHRYLAVLADTNEAKEIHYNLRYQVYCLEKGFEAPERFNNEMETDEYDDDSVHFVVKDCETGQWLGTLRLVISEFDKLPLNKHTGIDDGFTPNSSEKAAEVSRLSIIDNFRKGSNKPTSSKHTYETYEILLGLIRAAKAYCEEIGINHWYFLTNRALARILKRCGLTLHQAGAGCQHRGTRYPFLMKILEDGFGNVYNISNCISEMFECKDGVPYLLHSELEDGYAVAA